MVHELVNIPENSILHRELQRLAYVLQHLDESEQRI